MSKQPLPTVPAQVVDEDHVHIGGSMFVRVKECKNISNDSRFFICSNCNLWITLIENEDGEECPTMAIVGVGSIMYPTCCPNCEAKVVYE